MTIDSKKCITSSQQLVINLKTIKDFLRIDGDEDDDILYILTQAAVSKFENYTDKILMEQRWQVTYSNNYIPKIKLPLTPAIQIIKVEINSWPNYWHEMQQDLWDLEGDCVYNRALSYYPKLRITYDVGIAKNTADVPNEIKALLLRHIAYLYEARDIDNNVVLNDSENSIFFKQYDKFRNVELM